MTLLDSLLQHSDQFGWISSNATKLIGVAVAVRLGWIGRRGSQIVPGEEVIPRAWPRIIFLITGVIFALMYKYLRQSDKLAMLTVLTVVYLVGAVVGLILVTYILKRYGITYEDKTRRWFNRPTASIKLGGTVLTPEAQRIKGDKSLRTLLDDANGKVENVFTAESLADVHIKTLMYFILFQSCATLALFGASMLLGNNDG